MRLEETLLLDWLTPQVGWWIDYKMQFSGFKMTAATKPFYYFYYPYKKRRLLKCAISILFKQKNVYFIEF